VSASVESHQPIAGCTATVTFKRRSCAGGLSQPACAMMAVLVGMPRITAAEQSKLSSSIQSHQVHLQIVRRLIRTDDLE
jgi:hypothetical protein